ncbi:MAG: hypothetical protein AAF356_05670 [Planctomycetota bacterium]
MDPLSTCLSTCPECGVPAGGEVVSPAWRRRHRRVLVVWLLVLACFGCLASTRPWTAAWESVRGPAPGANVRIGDFALSRSAPPGVPPAWSFHHPGRWMRADGPYRADVALQRRLQGGMYPAATGAWAPSALTVGQVFNPALDDRGREALFLADIETTTQMPAMASGVFFADWRLPEQPEFRTRAFNMPRVLGIRSPVFVREIDVRTARGVALAWDTPPIRWQNGALWIRTLNAADARRARVYIVPPANVAIAAAIVLGAPVLAWLLLPPIWIRRTRRRRERTVRCLDCGYPLAFHRHTQEGPTR